MRTFGPWRRALVRVGTLLFAGYAALLLLLLVGQRALIYLPSKAPEAELLRVAEMERVVPWRDKDGGILGWFRPRAAGEAQAANRLVVFHGNAGYALNRTHFIEGFEGLDGGRVWQVYLFEYPGFGSRPGSPSEESITEAAVAAMETLGDGPPVYIVGESLGSGPASALAKRLSEKIAGVLLVTPYSSLVEVAAIHYPVVPVHWLLRDQWKNVEALASFPGRVAVMLAAEDEVIPVEQGHRLFAVVNGVKRLWVMPGATHNGIDFAPDAGWWRQVSDFLLHGTMDVPPEVGKKVTRMP